MKVCNRRRLVIFLVGVSEDMNEEFFNFNKRMG